MIIKSVWKFNKNLLLLLFTGHRIKSLYQLYVVLSKQFVQPSIFQTQILLILYCGIIHMQHDEQNLISILLCYYEFHRKKIIF